MPGLGPDQESNLNGILVLVKHSCTRSALFFCITGNEVKDMGVFDTLNRVMKKVEVGVKKPDLDKRFNELEQDINKAGKTPQSPGHGQKLSIESQRTHDHGYSRITTCVKDKYRGKIKAVFDPFQKKVELEVIACEACAGLPGKTKNRFLEYLKKQNYEPLFEIFFLQ
jgi:hypothetical protein